MPYPRLPELRARVGGALFVVVACGLSLAYPTKRVEWRKSYPSFRRVGTGGISTFRQCRGRVCSARLRRATARRPER